MPEPETIAMNANAAERFAHLLAIHGADPARWPPQEQAWMRAFATASDAAATQVHEAAALDAWLDAAPVPPAPAMQLHSAILLAAAREPHAPRVARMSLRASLIAFWHEIGGGRLAAPALAMAMAVGVGLGWMLQPPEMLSTASVQGSDDLLALAMFDDQYTELTP